MLKNIRIKTKLNIIVFLALLFIGFFYSLNYFTFDALKSNISEMTSKELLIKNTSNEIIKKLFIMNNLINNSIRERNHLVDKNRLLEINKDILLDIEVVSNFAYKYQKRELIQNITNVKLRYKAYFMMSQSMLESNIESEEEIVEIEISLAKVVDKTISELDTLIFLSEKDFTDRLFTIGDIIEYNFLSVSILVFVGIIFLLGLNTLFKNLLLQSIENLIYTAEYFMSLLDGNKTKKNYIKIVENNEIGKVIQQMNDKIPFIEANLLKLHELATKDTLTGLYNRRYLQEHITHFISKAKRNKTKLAVLLLDIDYFKIVNDTYGHDAGDIVLKSLSNVFLANVRESDMVIRYGGEEFVIILTDCTTDEDIVQIANKINAVTQQTNIYISNGFTIQKTVSIGIAMYPDDSESFETLLQKADEALYEAKNNGRNQVRRI